MTNLLTLTIDGREARVEPGMSVAAAIRIAGDGVTRTSVTGMARAPLCGMGICQECRVEVDGRRMLGCQTVCRTGMQIRTGRPG